MMNQMFKYRQINLKKTQTMKSQFKSKEKYKISYQLP